jgi:hypothetical protein
MFSLLFVDAASRARAPDGRRGEALSPGDGIHDPESEGQAGPHADS